MRRSLESPSCQSLPFMMKVVVWWCFVWFMWYWCDQCWLVFWVLVNPVLITRPVNSVSSLELDCATKFLPEPNLELGVLAIWRTCIRIAPELVFRLKKKQKVKLELEVPFKIIELDSKDRNQKVFFKSKNRIKTGKLDHSFLWSLFWFAQNWCNTYLQSLVWSFLLNLIDDTTFLTWECS